MTLPQTGACAVTLLLAGCARDSALPHATSIPADPSVVHRRPATTPSDTRQQADAGQLLQGQFLARVSWAGEADAALESDFDGDGHLERVVLGRDHPNGTRLYLGRGDEVYQLSTELEGLDDSGELSAGRWAELAAVDMTRDGIPELLVALGDGLSKCHLNVWFFDRQVWANSKRGEHVNPMRYIGHIEGQSEFVVVAGGKIDVPFGGQGRFFTMMWNGTGFVETN